MPKNERYILFDNGFFGYFIGKPRDLAHESWQRFFLDHINKTIKKFKPIKILCTPFLFLEYIGVTNFERPQIPLVEDKSVTQQNGIGPSVSKSIELYLDTARDFFSKQPTLSVGNLIAESNIKKNIHISKNPYAQFFADDTFQRYKARPNFEQDIYIYLASDLLQGTLERRGKNEFYSRVQLQHFKDLVQAMSSHYNIPIFRLIRSLLMSILPQGLSNRKVLELKRNSDLVDCDYVHYAVFGYRTNDGRRMVRVYTCDPLDKVIFRLRVAKFLYQSLIRASKPVFTRLKIKIPRPLYGIVYVCDPKNSKVLRTVTVKNLKSKKLF